MKSEKHSSTHEFALDRIESDKAVLIGEDDLELILPSKMLPKDAVEGNILILTIATDEEDKKRREQSAKELLNEILNPKG